MTVGAPAGASAPASFPTHPLVRLFQGDALAILRTLPDRSVHACVTSPPYYGLRDYKAPPCVWGGDVGHAHEWGADVVLDKSTAGTKGSGLTNGGASQIASNRFVARSAFCACGAWRGQLGLEPTPALYVEHLVEVFREVRRVLRPDGTLWLNLGDSYSSGGRPYRDPGKGWRGEALAGLDVRATRPDTPPGLKPKDLIGIPWRVAFALQSEGWTLREDIVWQKPNPMPESVTDRPTRAHEYVFLLSPSERYFYDAVAIAEPLASGPSDVKKMRERKDRLGGRLDESPLNKANPSTKVGKKRGVGGQARKRSGNVARSTSMAENGIVNDHRGRGIPWEDDGAGRNARSVWTIATVPYKGAHFAVFPPELAKRCLLAATPQGGCCDACGAPYARIVERSTEPHPDRWSETNDAKQFDPGANAYEAGGTLGVAHRRETVGWRMTCGCSMHQAGPPVPAVILDPFAGSGTVGAVALGHGRSAVLIEVSAAYCDLIVARVGPAFCRLEGRS